MWYPSHWHCHIFESGNTSANELQILDSYQRQAPVARCKCNGHTVDEDVVVLNQRRVAMQIRPPQEDPKAILHTHGRTYAEIAEIDPGCQAAKELILVARGNFLPCTHPCRQRVRTVVLTSVCLPVLSSSIVCTSMYSFCKHSLRWPCIHGSFATYALYVPNRVRTLSNSSHLHLQGTCSCLTVCRGAVPLCRSEHWWPSGH